jgi:hypothetical protein
MRGNYSPLAPMPDPLASIVSVAVISVVTVTAGGAQKTLEILLAVA